MSTSIGIMLGLFEATADDAWAEDPGFASAPVALMEHETEQELEDRGSSRPGRCKQVGRRLAAELRAKGFTFGQIGRRLGITRQRAHQLCTVTKKHTHSILCHECAKEIVPHFPHARHKDRVCCIECLRQNPAASFGEWLRAYRIAASMSRMTLARHSGLQQITIARLEQDKQYPYSRTLVRLFKVLGTGLAACMTRMPQVEESVTVSG